MHSPRADHREAHRRAREARVAHMLLAGQGASDGRYLVYTAENWRDANRLYTEVYLRTRRELKAARAAEKENQ